MGFSIVMNNSSNKCYKLGKVIKNYKFLRSKKKNLPFGLHEVKNKSKKH